MEETSNNIKALRRQRSMTQQQLADELGVHIITVSKLERGVMQLTTTWIDRLAEIFRVNRYDVWGGFKLKEIQVEARIYAGGQVRQVDQNQNNFSVYLPALGDAVGMWLHVRDNSFLPFFGKGDLLQFSMHIPDDLDGDAILNGRLCMFQVEDSYDYHVGIMDCKNTDGTYDIKFMNGRQLKGTNIRDLSYLTGYQPSWAVLDTDGNKITDFTI